MTRLIDRLLSHSSNEHINKVITDGDDNNEPNNISKDVILKKEDELDPDYGVWSWYSNNIKRGHFEEITGNQSKQELLVRVLDKYFNDETCNDGKSPLKLLVLSIPQDMMNNKSEVKNFLLSKFQIKNNKVINLNGNKTNQKQKGQDNTALYLIPIYDYDFHILQEYHENCSKERIATNSEEFSSNATMSQVQSIVSIQSDELIDSEYDNNSDEGSIYSTQEMDVPKIYSSGDIIPTEEDAKLDNEGRNTLGIDEEYIDDESDAIVLNFTRSSIRKHYIPGNNLYHITSAMSESISVLSIQSSGYGYEDEDEDEDEYDQDHDLINQYNSSKNYSQTGDRDDSLSVQYIYPSLSRVAAKDGSLFDMNLRVCHILAKEFGSNNLLHAIRQSHGEDWIIYDSEFSMNNLQYCQLDDILTGKPIDNSNHHENDSSYRKMMVLFCEII